jgi:hypothetical protein
MTINNHLLDLVNSYPVFEPNQVLTDKQLNGIVRYLEQQERLTRYCAVGMGIICGFEARREDGGIYLSGGCGLTSEGYLIHSPGVLLTHFREASIPPQWFGLNPNLFPQSFSGILELAPAPEVPDSEVYLLEEADIADRVLVLVLECVEDDNADLCHNDCDERGNELNFILHRLLISRDQADTILQALYNPDDAYVPSIYADMEELFYYKYFMAYPHVGRFGYHSEGGETTATLCNIVNYNLFQSRYREILTPMANRIDAALQNVRKVFSPVFTPGETPATALMLDPALRQRILNGTFHRFEVQPLADYLTDLIHAYLEFVENAFDLIADCPADAGRFPRHLFVRYFGENAEPDLSPSTVYRTPYTQPPIYNGNRARLEEVRTLYRRLEVMATQYATPGLAGNNETRITPSSMEARPLSQRAMPFYYPPTLREWWNPRRRRMGRAEQVYSYHRPAMPPYNDPLVFHMEGSDFLRIEGHIGKPFAEVLGELAGLQKRYNLPFQVVALKIGTEFDEDLFQFECEDLECERRRYREEYGRERQALLERLPIDSPNFPEAVSMAITNLRAALTETLDGFNIDTFLPLYEVLQFSGATQFPGFLPPQGKDVFIKLNDCYVNLNAREDEIRKRHLFHEFAKVYPGMEHGSGVPVGGTFIIVYVDPMEVRNEIAGIRSFISSLPLNNQVRDLRLATTNTARLVVGDFYLPYACVSCCPPICYMVNQPAPVLIVTPLVFCSGDRERHRLEVLAYPGGGVLVGPGYEFIDGEHFFTPSETGIAPPNSGVVLLRYLEGGAEVSVQLTLVAPPEASFDLFFETGIPAPDAICVNQGPLSFLTPTGEPLGVFAVRVNGVAQPEALEGNFFFPDRLSAVLPAEVAITHTVIAQGNLCPGVFIRNIIVNPLPDAGFYMTLGDIQDDLEEVCRHAEQVFLTPHSQEGSSVFEVHIVNDNGILEPVADAIFSDNILRLSSFDVVLREAGRVEVVIRHLKSSPDSCDAVLDRTLIIYSTPPVPTITTPQAICISAPAVQLSADTPGGTFYYRLSGADAPGTALPDNMFDPALAESAPATVIIRYEVGNGPCTNFAESAILITPPPVPTFEAEFFGNQGPNILQLRITNIAPQGGPQEWQSEPAPVNGFPATGGQVITLVYNRGEVIDRPEPGVTIRLEVMQNGCPGTFTLFVPFFPTPEVGPNDPTGPDDSTIVFLRVRDAALRSELDELSADTALAATPAFQMTRGLMSFQGEPEELNARFTETVDTLAESAAKAKTGGPRHTKLLRLMTLASEFFMDRQIVGSPRELAPEAKETLRDRLAGMKKAGLDPKALKAEWKGAELKKTLSAPAADEFNKLLK